MPEDKRQIAFTGTTEYRAKLQREALDRGIKVQQLLEEAVEAYLQGRESSPAVSIPPPTAAGPHQEWITKLVTILTEGDPDQVVGIQSNLTAFCDSIELHKLRRRRKKAAGE